MNLGFVMVLVFVEHFENQSARKDSR